MARICFLSGVLRPARGAACRGTARPLADGARRFPADGAFCRGKGKARGGLAPPGPNQTEKQRFSARRQAVCFETRSVSI